MKELEEVEVKSSRLKFSLTDIGTNGERVQYRPFLSTRPVARARKTGISTSCVRWSQMCSLMCDSSRQVDIQDTLIVLNSIENLILHNAQTICRNGCSFKNNVKNPARV